MADLDVGLPDGLGTFDAIAVIRYLNLPLITELVGALVPGGTLIVETLLAGNAGGVGPSSGRFRAQPGEVAEACSALRAVHTYEGEVIDPDGRSAHVAQFVGVL